MFDCVGFMDELDCKDGRCIGRRNGFFYSAHVSRVFVDRSETYDAYAPLPMVFDTIRKGKSPGRGSSWLWKGVSISILARVLKQFKRLSAIYLGDTYHIQQSQPDLHKRKEAKILYPMASVMIACKFQEQRSTRH